MWTVHRSSPICNFNFDRIPSILFFKYLFIDIYKAISHHLRLQSASGSILGLYYLPHKNINLNWTTADQPGIEPESPGPKVAKLPMCYAPLTAMVIYCQMHSHQFVKNFKATNQKQEKIFLYFCLPWPEIKTKTFQSWVFCLAIWAITPRLQPTMLRLLKKLELMQKAILMPL